MAQCYINVALTTGEEIQIPVEMDGCVYLETLNSQDRNAFGLKFIGQMERYRAVSQVSGRLFPPLGGWTERMYFATGEREIDTDVHQYDSEGSKDSTPGEIDTDVHQYDSEGSKDSTPVAAVKKRRLSSVNRQEEVVEFINPDESAEFQHATVDEEIAAELSHEEGVNKEQDMTGDKQMERCLRQFQNHELGMLQAARAIKREVKNAEKQCVRKHLQVSYPVLANDYWYLLFKRALSLAEKSPEPPPDR